jgi:hypothetical protein
MAPLLLPPVLLPAVLPTVLLVGKGEEEVSLFMVASPLGWSKKLPGDTGVASHSGKPSVGHLSAGSG